ncbi:hypothetical protein MUK42_33758 [Musa troglodytarum]|uniref:Uncharacterized protein n=1 Tax=Musa troglodytarum TaxID=320322 RepID=A0A9E7E8R7_9LILI|nr:hypothetical protein MUK42_33758 [Musa troglodytarum]
MQKLFLRRGRCMGGKANQPSAYSCCVEDTKFLIPARVALIRKGIASEEGLFVTPDEVIDCIKDQKLYTSVIDC